MQASHQDKLTLQVHHHFIQPARFDLDFNIENSWGKGQGKARHHPLSSVCGVMRNKVT